MSEYLLTAKHADGRVVTEWVGAASGDEAVELLRQRGCTEIVFHIEDFYTTPNIPSRRSHRISPQQYLALRQGRGYGARVWSRVFRYYRAAWVLSVTALAILLMHRTYGRPWGMYDDLLLGALVVPFILGCIAALQGRSQRYLQMVDAACWGRWEEVLQRLPELQGRIPPHELAVREAQALAGLGSLEEGLRVVEPFANNPRIPEWLYWTRLASVYDAARRSDLSLHAMEKAFEADPDNPTVLLDLASLLLRERQNAARVRNLLDQVRRHVLNDVSGGCLSKAEGMLALEEGRESVAIHWLEKAKRDLLPLYAPNPVARAIFDQLDAYLALAHAACGDAEAAADHFRRAEPRLRALRYDHLLRRCQQVVKLSVTPSTSRIETDNPYQSPGT